MTAQKIKSLAKGFTLIELLVVIGILGILATALIATIDPFEQLKKASDSNVKNAAVEFVNGSLRYDVTHNALPWDALTNGGYAGCGANTGAISGANLNSVANGGITCAQALINDGELKDVFTDATNVTKEIYVSGDTSHITACYKPQSKAGQHDTNTKYLSTGATTTGCISQDAANVGQCYYCALL